MFDKLKKGINDVTAQAQERVNVAKDAKAMLGKADTADLVQVKKSAEDAVEADAKTLAAVTKLLALYETVESKMTSSPQAQEFSPLQPSYKERSAQVKEALKILQGGQAPALPAVTPAEKDAIAILRAKEAVGMPKRPSTAGSSGAPPMVQAEAVPADANQKSF
mmetsp:Transcript_24075/g.55603  ORF Transcript_24075/g.55603 Transcript_24075/m.55603 type:complete len:164 (+) Transcript_24075:53-544(+)